MEPYRVKPSDVIELNDVWWFNYTTHLEAVRKTAHEHFLTAHPSEQLNLKSQASELRANAERSYEDDLLRGWEAYRKALDARGEKYVTPREVERITKKRFLESANVLRYKTWLVTWLLCLRSSIGLDLLRESDDRAWSDGPHWLVDYPIADVNVMEREIR